MKASYLRVPSSARVPSRTSQASAAEYHALSAEDTAGLEHPMSPSKDPSSPHRQSEFNYVRSSNVLNSMPYAITSILALLAALFVSPMFVLLDVPDDPGVPIQDALMLSVMVFFIWDLCYTWWKHPRGYACSSFFWMDLLGTASMPFEVSFLLGVEGTPSTTKAGLSSFSPVIFRTARAARFPARVARLPRLLKFQHWIGRHLPGADSSMDEEPDDEHHHHDDIDHEAPAVDARVLKARLANSLSSKAALLTMTLMMGLPLFSLWHVTEEDLAIAAWGQALQLGYGEALRSVVHGASTESTAFRRTVNAMLDFFSPLPYQPIRLEGFGSHPVIAGHRVYIPGEELIQGDDPGRMQNLMIHTMEVCQGDIRVDALCSDIDNSSWSLFVDFTELNKLNALMDTVTICFLVVVMLVTSFGLTRAVDIMVVIPVERMLGTVQMMAKILHTVAHMTGFKIRAEDHHPASLETLKGVELLEGVFRSLLSLTEKIMSSGMVESEDVKALDREGQGVLLDVLNIPSEKDKEFRLWEHRAPSLDSGGLCVPDMPVADSAVQSWDLNLLQMSELDLNKVVLHIFFDTSIGRNTCRPSIELAAFHFFAEDVRKRYHPNPYHNWIHGCDVLASTYRTLHTLRCWEWLSEIDSLAMFVSALCHDVGHPGRTTPFLVETGHELAMRYNDTSPLENMHCATLFEICQHEDMNIFRKLDRDDYKQVRKVCVSAILNTDNARHFEMVKALKAAYELTSDICDLQSRDPERFKENYKDEVLKKSTPLWHQLILHMCDVATPLKGWDTSRAWVERLHNEFFSQGDEEKKLGIPVGMLNDRNKVLRSGVEHGFINFLVAPMMVATVNIFPLLHERLDQMFQNACEWKQYWVQDTNPSPEDIAKRDEDLDRIEDQIERMRFRRPMHTLRTINISNSVSSNDDE